MRGDTDTPEQNIPATGMPGRDWETCMTMNGTWGYMSFDNNWKSTGTLIRNLVDIASKGGNYLLNVGPTAEGLIPQPSVERLQEVGRWMKVNGEAIYATSASPCAQPSWGRITTKAAGRQGERGESGGGPTRADRDTGQRRRPHIPVRRRSGIQGRLPQGASGGELPLDGQRTDDLEGPSRPGGRLRGRP